MKGSKSIGAQAAGQAPAPQILRTGTVDWRLCVRTETGTVATDTEQIKKYEAIRARGVQEDLDISRKKARVHNLLQDICKRLEILDEIKPEFSPRSFDSENLVFTVNMKGREMNIQFENEFLALAGKFDFEATVVHKLYSASCYRLIDSDNKTIILDSNAP